MQIKNRLPDFEKFYSSFNEASNDEIVEEELKPTGELKLYSGPIGNVLKKYLYINERLKEINTHLNTMISMTKADRSNDFNQKEFDKLRSNSIKIGNEVIKKFKKRESKLPDKNDFTTLARMKRLLYYGFFQQYVILWTEHEKFLMEFERKLKKKLQNQSQILNCNLTDEDIDTLIENKNTSLFMTNIIQDAETERKKLDEIQDRFQDLKKLEKSITEVHNLFISLQTLVAEQGDTIQRIETHFDATRDYVEQAKKSIQVAEKIKKNRFCQFRCCF